MADDEVRRRLAAIVAADVAGYSRLVAADEEGTLSALRAHRQELIDPKITAYHGRVANTAGDSILIEFASVIDALRCMLDVQRGMAERNAGLPAERRIAFRIGINLGDVVEQDGDLLGDGVNVAARLEGLAEPGGICLSRAARDQVRDRMDIALADLGEVEVKNIPRPVRVFRVVTDHGGTDAHISRGARVRSIARPAVIAGALLALLAVAAGLAWWKVWTPPKPESNLVEVLDRPSVAVLPFENFSDDQDQTYFADGITEDITIGLSKVSGLFVISSNSVFAYRDNPVEPRIAAQELGVRHILTGTVRRAGDRLRITAQLVDATKGNTLWAETYDRKITDIFAVQSEIGARVVKALSVTLKASEQERLYQTHTASIPAYELFLRARRTHFVIDPENVQQAEALYEQVVEADPSFAGGYAGLSFLLSLKVRWGRAPGGADDVQRALDLANKAVSLDPDFAWGYIAQGGALRADGKADAAVAAVRRAVELQPNDADALLFLGLYQTFAGAPGIAIEHIKASMRLDPRPTNRQFWFLGWSYYLSRQFDNAVDAFETWDKLSSYEAGVIPLAASYAMAGDGEKAKAAVERYLAADPGFDASRWTFLKNFQKAEHRDLIDEGLRRAGFPGVAH